jgi:hypothetical protein
MFTVRRAERIMGHEASTCFDKSWYAAAICNCTGKETPVQGHGKTEDEALRDLVENVYKRHGQIVAMRQKYRCRNCQGIRPLQKHHLERRSKGRNDRVSNIAMLCPVCHELETNPA